MPQPSWRVYHRTVVLVKELHSLVYLLFGTMLLSGGERRERRQCPHNWEHCRLRFRVEPRFSHRHPIVGNRLQGARVCQALVIFPMPPGELYLRLVCYARLTRRASILGWTLDYAPLAYLYAFRLHGTYCWCSVYSHRPSASHRH